MVARVVIFAGEMDKRVQFSYLRCKDRQEGPSGADGNDFLMCGVAPMMVLNASGKDSGGPMGPWDVIYSTGKAIKNQHFPRMSAKRLQGRIDHISRDARVLLVTLVKRKFFSKKTTARVYAHYPTTSLSVRHNLLVYITGLYTNGEDIRLELESAFRDAEREERIRTFRVEQQIHNVAELKKELKGHLPRSPVLLLFNLYNSKIWEAQKSFYAASVVDHEHEVGVFEVCYDPESDLADSVKEVFATFQVGATPTWVLVTPVLADGKKSTRISRFEPFREKYFLRQISRGRANMSPKDGEHVAEAFEAFVLWGLNLTEKARPKPVTDL